MNAIDARQVQMLQKQHWNVPYSVIVPDVSFIDGTAIPSHMKLHVFFGQFWMPALEADKVVFMKMKEILNHKKQRNAKKIILQSVILEYVSRVKFPFSNRNIRLQ